MSQNVLSPAWLRMTGQDITDPVKQLALLQGTGLNQSTLDQMAQSAAPISSEPQPPPMPQPPMPTAPAPRGQTKPSRNVAQAPSDAFSQTLEGMVLQGAPISLTEKIKQSGALPSERDLFLASAEAQQNLENFRKQRFEEEQAGIKDYQNQIAQMEALPRATDWRPLAALIDSWTGSRLSGAAQALAPEDIRQEKARVTELKRNLNNMKGDLSKSQYGALKEQLDGYLGSLRQMSQERILSARLGTDTERKERLERRDLDKDTMEYQKRVGERLKMLNNFQPIQSSLGFDIEQFDENTGTVAGKPVDAPGVKIPGLQAIYAATPEGERFRTRFQSLLNDTLRAYSGAAVTDSEAAKTLQRFATNPGAVRQSSFLAALKDFKRLLKEEIQDIGGGFRPEVLENFERQRGAAKGSGALKESSAPLPSTSSTGLSPEKEKRLQELRAKLGKG